jgi:transcriptional repressor NrdR
MYCPKCNAQDTKVIDSRLIDQGEKVKRRRACTECNERFTTFECISFNFPRVIKRDGARVSFDENKLRHGLIRALEKRPTTTSQLESIINNIKKQLCDYAHEEIKALQIGEWVMDALREVDQIAYVRFASVYRSFEDINEFSDEIDRLIQTTQ